MRLRFTLHPRKNSRSLMKDTIKSIYLNFRKYALRVLSVLISNRKPHNFISGKDIQKILFIRIDRIGDLVLSTPALRAVKQAFPHAQLIVLASHASCSVLVNNPYVDQVIVYDHRQKFGEKLRCLRELRKHKFDLAIDPYSDYEIRTALIALLSAARIRVGYVSYGREAFLNLKVSSPKENKSFVDITLDVLKPLGIDAKSINPEIILSEDEDLWSQKWLKDQGIGSKPIIGIHPGAYYESQRWPIESFAKLVNQIQDNLEVDVVIFGSQGDKNLVDRICSLINSKVLTYVGNDLRCFAALVSHCCILICNNSGPLHVAVAMNIPTISFMGPTNKDKWMPIGNIHKVLRIDDLSCIGCNLGACKIGTHDCMRLITPLTVLNAVKGVLQR